ncbi:unnamed protein product [Rotaria magnacalcarata]|uniref:Uncharacterized protein n=3 Tax=Rotaria magnacalcarata TaxID=392030 RepID=A0A819ME04_9BILA|nr:unnamed protein product [Rotaria magnacalcarata]CAF2059295.1 unnamed protein product [Rotaria magnacalcarata]CAF2065030.1 unnamed protein product [Rotaria magnacalcarata]CAF3915717.1 unnamed protein product [Rotaria magnacalcarata]CAF3978948.1 unnamed protein product [Rotaria magnacalcarata]
MHNLNIPKPTILVWTDLSQDHVAKLEELNDPETINNFFIKVFNLEPNTKRTTILCDLYYYALNFARTNKFNHEQISTFISILKRVHEMCIQTPFTNMEETYKSFKALILKHSLSRPPYSLRIFTADTTKKVIDYIVDTYFRHYKMYKYIFTATIDFNLKFTFDGMTRDSLKKLDEHGITITADDTNTVKDHEEKQSQNDEKHVENSELLEVRKLIQAMVKEEIQKIQSTTTDDAQGLRPPTDKHRPVKSSSTKTSKSQAPK